MQLVNDIFKLDIIDTYHWFQVYYINDSIFVYILKQLPQ